ncbi:LysE family translocator [Photobacterium sp. 1_MG-2023]|uniref:LysE family translocator n=1 Tax=Photobacterium sp. 1_MG-2023 TaxID=3062646 RepID=UPI0026E45CF9|nr:LysE family translocator [Photobacterium sp. 1_MG-2023]MDO6707388.1 LysE family translocator [Photobacterium sp. 1_MG-2023]
MSLILAMVSFSLAMSISPGPVNFVILSSGANYGIRKTFYFVSGATIGFTLLLVFIGLGFYEVIELYPYFLKYLSVAGSALIIYMGYLIATAKPEVKIEKQSRPTFLQGFLLQWLNPKAWLACVAGVSIFSSPEGDTRFFIFSLIYFIVCYISLALWSFMGAKSTIVLNSDLRLKVFNWVMGFLLVSTAFFLLYTQLK